MNLDVYKNYRLTELSKVSTIIDIGVSDGAFLHNSVEYFPSEVKRIGIDPIEYSNYPKWDRIDYHYFAVGDTCETIDFVESENKVGSSKFEIEGTRFKVNQKRMDCFLDENQHIDISNLFVKLDTQGADIECLESFGKYLSNIAGLQIETWMRPYSGVGHYFSETVAAIDGMGFYVAEFLDPLERSKDLQLGQIDLLCFNKASNGFKDLDW